MPDVIWRFRAGFRGSPPRPATTSLLQNAGPTPRGSRVKCCQCSAAVAADLQAGALAGPPRLQVLTRRRTVPASGVPCSGDEMRHDWRFEKPRGETAPAA